MSKIGRDHQVLHKYSGQLGLVYGAKQVLHFWLPGTWVPDVRAVMATQWAGQVSTAHSNEQITVMPVI